MSKVSFLRHIKLIFEAMQEMFAFDISDCE